MTDLINRLAGALRDARSSLTGSSGSGEERRSLRTSEADRSPTTSEAEPSPRTSEADRSPTTSEAEPSPRTSEADRSLRSARERSDRARHEGPADATTAIVCQAAALLLAYPEAELLDRLDVIESALFDTPAVEQFAPVLAHLRGATLGELQAFHVREFDLSRRHALHLSYWTDGDTRRRGEVLAEIKQVYRDSGLVVDLGRELPDYLPVVLEFAVADADRGRALLQRFRASLELIRLGLTADHLPHAGVLTAICTLLPGESPRTRAEVQAQFGEIQPVEFVGMSTSSTSGFPAGRG